MTPAFLSSVSRLFKINSAKLFEKGSFAQNLAVAFSGNATAQIIGFAFTPIVARIFSPAQYGLFAVFIAIASNLSSLSTLQLPTGFVAARNKSDLRNLVQLSLISLFLFTLLVTLTIGLFRDELAALFDIRDLGIAIYLIPAQVFFMGLDYILLGWNVSLKEFARGAWGRILSVVVGKSSTLAWGIWLVPHSLGLIVGNLLISAIDSAVKFSRSIRSEIRGLWTDIDGNTLRQTLRTYSSYPLLVTPGVIVVAVSQQLPLFFFTRYFTAEWAGFYALASTVVAMPLQMIISPTTTVFLQKAAEVNATERTRLGDLVSKLFRNLFAVSFGGLIIFVLVSEWLFSFVFGDKWALAGLYAGFIAVMMILQVPQQPIAVLFRLCGKEAHNFWLNVVGLVLRTGALTIGIVVGEPVTALALFALFSVITTSASLAVLFSIVGLKWSRIIPYFLLILMVLLLYFWYSQS